MTSPAVHPGAGFTSRQAVLRKAFAYEVVTVGWNVVEGVIASFAGIICLALPELTFRALPFSAGLAAGLLAAIAYVTISYLGRFEHPLTVIFYFTLWSLLGSVPLFFSRFQMPIPRDLSFLIGAGVFGLVGQWGMTRAYFHGPASVISVFSLITPLIGYLLGLLFWQETLTPVSALGMVLILAGSATLSVQYHRKRGV